MAALLSKVPSFTHAANNSQGLQSRTTVRVFPYAEFVAQFSTPQHSERRWNESLLKRYCPNGQPSAAKHHRGHAFGAWGMTLRHDVLQPLAAQPPRATIGA